MLLWHLSLYTLLLYMLSSWRMYEMHPVVSLKARVWQSCTSVLAGLGGVVYWELLTGVWDCRQVIPHRGWRSGKRIGCRMWVKLIQGVVFSTESWGNHGLRHVRSIAGIASVVAAVGLLAPPESGVAGDDKRGSLDLEGSARIRTRNTCSA
jgi:hypothetical protein